MIGTTTSRTYNDSTAPAGSALIYKVRGIMSSAVSNFAADYAHTFTLTDPSLIHLTIRAAHIEQLRSIVNGLLTMAGTSPSAFTDPSLTGVTAKMIHVTEMRSAINRLRTALGLPASIFSNPADQIIRASTTEELRNALQ